MRPNEGENGSGLSRRAYLKLAGATAGAVGLGTTPVPESERDRGALRSAHERTTYYTGPDADRPESAPRGTRYFGADTGAEYVATDAGWRAAPMATPELAADRIAGIADHVVTSTRELRAAFRRLRPGDTVVLAGGTYRPSEWLDVTVDDVTVVGQSRRETLVKPADGANVGGFRIGPGRRVENVTVRGIGVDGNARAMDDSVKRCHAFLVDNARNVVVRDCFATRTHPYHEHDVGGSGFTVRRRAADVAILGNYTRDIGDRSIQVAGTGVTVAYNRLTEGFDRSISLDVRHPDGRKHYAQDVLVAYNLGRDNSHGSVVGASQGAPHREGAGNYAIVGNVAAGRHRRTVFLGIEENVENVAIVGNAGRQGEFREPRSGIYVAGNVSSFVVAGNSLADYSGHGIEIAGTGSGFTCAGNAVSNPRRDGVRVETREGTVANNVVEGAGAAGVSVAAADVAVANNTIRDTRGHGVHVSSAAGPAVVSSNVVAGHAGPDGDALRVESRDTVVAANVVSGREWDREIREADPADGNLYVANALPRDGRGWALSGPRSRAVGNVPDHDRTREFTATDGVYDLSFDRPYDRKPSMTVQTESPAVWGVEWRRDDDGNVTGATLTFRDPGGGPVSPTVQVYVDGQ
jgi:hypothetical protein